MKLFIVVHFFFCGVSVATVVDSVEEKQDIPTFIKEPPSVIYYPYPDKDFERSELSAVFDLEAIVYPSNSTITIAKSVPNDTENYLFLPLLRTSTHVDRISSSASFHQPYAILNTASQVATQPYDTYLWRAKLYNVSPNTILHLLASTSSGTTRSRPIRLVRMELPGFPRFADESLSLLIGNTGRLVCHLPRAQPSLPTVNFYHNGIRLDLSDGTRYRLIYLGGDGTGIPWEERGQKSKQQQGQLAPMTKLGDGGFQVHDETIFYNPVPSAAVLLIHPLRLTDSGEYRCQARIGSREVFSEQRTLLSVSKPHEKVPPRLQFSSDDPEISYLYGHLIVPSPSVIPGSDHTDEHSAPLADLDSIATSKDLGIGGGINHANADSSGGDRWVASSTPTRVFTVPEGMNLTLFCTYESAPIVSTRWFFDSLQSNIHQDGRFGVLIISHVIKSNEGTYTCSPNTPALDTTRKSFRIVVKKRRSLTMEPGPVVTRGIGQNITLHCTDQETRRSVLAPHQFQSSPTVSHDPEPDFRHLKLSTDLGWYHNGKSIGVKQKYGKVYSEVTNDGTKLHIFNISIYDQGIYQCWKIDSIGAWSTASSVLMMAGEKSTDNLILESKLEEGITQERTREGITGHMTCNISAILRKGPLKRSDLGIQSNDIVIVWYRGASDSEPIDLSGNQSGGIKYLRTTVDWASQILSVVNPRKSKDDGFYACKVYDRITNSFLGEMKFELIIDSDKEALVDGRSKESVGLSLATIQAKGDHTKMQPMLLGEIPNIQDISSGVKSALEREFPISTPRVRRVANFTTSIHLSWSLLDRTMAAQMVRFEVELRMLKSIADRRPGKFKRSVSTSRTGTVPFSMDESYWTLPSRIANAGTKTAICLTEAKEIQAGRVYSVRIVGIVRPEDQMELTSEIAVKSPWSERISFENLVNLQPTITTLQPVNRTRLKLEWTLPPTSTWDFPVQVSDRAIYVHFQALITPIVLTENSSHPQKSRWKSCHQEQEGSSVQYLEKQSFLGSWHLNADMRNLRPFRSTLGELEPNSTYAIAIYGLLSLSERHRADPDSSGWYTLLSAEAIEQTLSVDQVEVETSLDRADKDVIKPEGPNTVEIPNKKEANSSKSSTEQESHILVVILGSLAGVLLVISLALIGLCIWYHLRTKRLVYQEATESPNKVGLTTSSLELSSTPNGYLMHTTNPVLNFMDSSFPAVQFTGSPQMQHLGITNPNLRQLTELQSLYQFSACPSSQNWSTMPFNPAEKAQQQVLHQQQQQQQQAWVNADLEKSSDSKNVSVPPGLYSHEKRAHPVQSAVHHHHQQQQQQQQHQEPSGGEQELDSLLRCDSDLSEKVAHTNEVKRDPFVNLITSPDGNLSSAAASDEEGDGTRIIQNDQSSSIYSHIGSESTLNELPPKLLDRRGCFSPQPPPPPPIGAGPIGLSALFNSGTTQTGMLHPSDNPQIQRPIPMYLSTTGIQPQIPNPELWNAGVLPMNMGGPGNWLNHPAVQASLLARQQSVPVSPYPPILMDSSILPSPYPITQPPAMFYRTLPNRRTVDLTPRLSVAPIPTTVMSTGTTTSILGQPVSMHDPLLLLQNREWSGNPLGNGSIAGSLTAASARRDYLGEDSDLDQLGSGHPSAQFVLKYWMANTNKSDDPIREVASTGATRLMQNSSKPPSSAESGRGSRPSGAGSEHSNSGEERKHHELAQTVGDSGVDLNASVNNETELCQPKINKAGDPLLRDKKSDQRFEHKQNKPTKSDQKRPHRTTHATNSAKGLAEGANNVTTGPKTDRQAGRKRPHSEFASQSSLDSNDRRPQHWDEPKSDGHLDSETWQLRESSSKRETTSKPVSTSSETPSISSSI